MNRQQPIREPEPLLHRADRFEPPAHVSIHRINVGLGRDAIAITVDGERDMRTFVYEGHALCPPPRSPAIESHHG